MAGLERQLVPVAALTVLVCRYPKAVSPLEYDDAAATQFEAETNRLPALPASGKGVSCGAEAPTYVVRFAGATQHVDVVDFCGDATNGAFEAEPSAKWIAGLQTPTLGFPPAPRSVPPTKPRRPSTRPIAARPPAPETGSDRPANAPVVKLRRRADPGWSRIATTHTRFPADATDESF